MGKEPLAKEIVQPERESSEILQFREGQRMSNFKKTCKEQKAITKVNAVIPQKLTPSQAIHKVCVDCVGSPFAVRDCQGDSQYDGPCLLFPHRLGMGRPSVKLIRKYCLYCMGGNVKLVRECHSGACPFLCYRMGKNPNMGLSEQEKQIRSRRFKS
jgi:hypothetical protein